MKLRRALSTLAVASMLVACGGQDGASSGTTLKDGDTIKIGFIGPKTGETSTYGIPVANSIELAIKDYNASENAKYKVELIAEDSAGDETQAVGWERCCRNCWSSFNRRKSSCWKCFC